MPDIKIAGVTRRFGSATAVEKIDLNIADGEFLTLLGPSGCGKTTTLRMVAGLERNDAGTIAIGDRLVSDASRGIWAAPEKREIGMVFQSYAIWPHMSVFENVAYPLTVRRRPQSEIREKVNATLRLVEMERYADRPAPALSGGQQQRVAIARALAFQPQVLLMDEPLSNLDAKLREQMRTELREIQKKLGITTLYVTHDQDEAITLSDRIVVMSAGKILQVDTPEGVYERPASVAVASFFGSPAMPMARVTEIQQSGSGTLTAVVSDKGWSGRVNVAESVMVGDTVALVLRPDVLSMTERQSTAPAWDGSVKLDIYRGGRRTVLVDTAVGVLSVDVDANVRVRTGERVRVACDPMKVWAVKASSAEENNGAE